MELKDVVIDEVNILPFKNFLFEGIDFEWSGNIGFGHVSLFRSIEGGSWFVDNEDMSREFCEMVINKALKEALDSGFAVIDEMKKEDKSE